VVKVVTSRNGYALYFSRAPIPYPRDSLSSESSTHEFASRHIGIYGFSVSTLKQFVTLTPGDYEIEEKLEQLRWLQNGGEILVRRAFSPSPGGVDTPEELERVRANWPGN
jgi:3-deoxy-manno-octulosonate cytidylyltransferase (CMP-KDO synthetase)